MKKIVIISRPGQIRHELIALLTALFPECEISIAAPGGQDFEPRLLNQPQTHTEIASAAEPQPNSFFKLASN